MGPELADAGTVLEVYEAFLFVLVWLLAGLGCLALLASAMPLVLEHHPPRRMRHHSPALTSDQIRQRSEPTVLPPVLSSLRTPVRQAK